MCIRDSIIPGTPATVDEEPDKVNGSGDVLNPPCSGVVLITDFRLPAENQEVFTDHEQAKDITC